jgi:hypothetical protein
MFETRRFVRNRDRVFVRASAECVETPVQVLIDSLHFLPPGAKLTAHGHLGEDNEIVAEWYADTTDEEKAEWDKNQAAISNQQLTNVLNGMAKLSSVQREELKKILDADNSH